MYGTLLRSKLVSFTAISVIVLAAGAVRISAAGYDTYIWQKPVASQINSSASQTYVPILNQEISAIVTKGALAPLVMHYADQPGEGYAIYHERGRIITTLAMAYPYVSATLQTQIKTYVQSMLASGGAEAFWSSTFKKHNEGVQRRLHGYVESMPEDRMFKNVSALHVIYGLWLYGDRTGDWTTIQNNWGSIKTFYQNNKNSNILYSSLSGFIAMARLARQFNDSTTQSTVLSDINTQFNAGLNPATIETRQKATSYSYFYSERNAWAFPGQPWMYLNISPEVARYINDNAAIKNDYLNRLQSFQGKYSPWWLYQLPVFNRWTGDEGIGTTPELFGLSYTAERWVKKTPATTLDTYIRSIPTGIGDSFWVESLVWTLEANGQNCWTDVRDGTKACESGPSSTSTTSSTTTSSAAACVGNLNTDNIVDISDYSILALDYFKTTANLLNPKSDINGDGFVDIEDYSRLAENFFKICN